MPLLLCKYGTAFDTTGYLCQKKLTFGFKLGRRPLLQSLQRVRRAVWWGGGGGGGGAVEAEVEAKVEAEVEAGVEAGLEAGLEAAAIAPLPCRALSPTQTLCLTLFKAITTSSALQLQSI